MNDRPGRILYSFNYDGLSEEVILDYLKENLEVQSKFDKILEILLQVKNLSFDIMQSFVKENNIFKDIDPEELTEGFNMSRNISYLENDYNLELYLGSEKVEDIFDEHSGRDDYYVSFSNLNFDMLYSIPEVYVFDIAGGKDNNYFNPGQFIVKDVKTNLEKLEIIFELPEDGVDLFNDFIEEIKEETNEEFVNLLKDKFIKNNYRVKLICTKKSKRKSYSNR